MKNKYSLLSFTLLIFSILLFGCTKRNPLSELNLSDIHNQDIDSNSYSFTQGDILVRPNWSWLPGSSFVKNGRRSGHVAVVVKDGKGSTIEEALRNTTVIEALFFDQQSRHFIFKKEGQIRETTAWVSFGKKFKGIRYRLRTKLTDTQIEEFIHFNYSALEKGYRLLSMKNESMYSVQNLESSTLVNDQEWNCATLTWASFNFATSKDIDSNGGMIIYPNDIITNPIFNEPGGRVRF